VTLPKGRVVVERLAYLSQRGPSSWQDQGHEYVVLIDSDLMVSVLILTWNELVSTSIFPKG